jgi:hypothetical protein
MSDQEILERVKKLETGMRTILKKLESRDKYTLQGPPTKPKQPIKTICGLFLALLLLVMPAIADDVQLMWDANPGENITHYTLYYGNSPDALEQNQQVPLDSTIDFNGTTYPTAIVSNLTPGEWYFAVTATNSAGESPMSEVIGHAIIAQPPATAWIATIRLDTATGAIEILSLIPEDAQP